MVTDQAGLLILITVTEQIGVKVRTHTELAEFIINHEESDNMKITQHRSNHVSIRHLT